MFLFGMFIQNQIENHRSCPNELIEHSYFGVFLMDVAHSVLLVILYYPVNRDFTLLVSTFMGDKINRFSCFRVPFYQH